MPHVVRQSELKQVYAPGCALMIYKPELAERIRQYLNSDLHLTCCRHNPQLKAGTQVINTCAGCDRRYRELYEGISTISLWEVLADRADFPFPDYGGMEISIHDACPTRSEERVHTAIRRLLERMNLRVVEPRNTRTKAVCCGDSFFGVLPTEEVKQQMRNRAGEMPCQDVAVYCVSCIKAMHIGGKRPRYIVDLLFGEDTLTTNSEPDAWHRELQEFIDAH
jgi:Fe-S oxidoreductase